MAYIFDPIRNTFVDDEDTSLGNKLALNDNNIIFLNDNVIRQNFYTGSLVTKDGPNKGKYMVKFSYNQDYGNPKFKGVQYGTKEEIEKLIADRKIAADASYKAGVDKAAQLQIDKKNAEIKRTIDSFIEQGDYENFKSQPYESQLKRKLPSGNIRQSLGGRVNPKTFQYIRDMLDAGDFENLSEITGRSKEELIQFSNKIPEKGVIDIEQRATAAKESYPEERKLTEEQKQEAEKKVQAKRKDRLTKTTGDTKFIKAKNVSGERDFAFHHIKQIGGEVPLTANDVTVIDKVMNSQLSPYNRKLNDIADSISKNITLAFEAQSLKKEGDSLDFLKRVDTLNNEAEQIVNKAIKELPKEFKPLIGFNKFYARTDEYGLPLDDKIRVEPIGGGTKKGDYQKPLTKYSRKEVQDLQKQIDKQVKILELKKQNPDLKTADEIEQPEKSKNRNFFKKFKERMDASKMITSKIPGGAVALTPLDFMMSMAAGAPLVDAAASAGSYLIKDPYLGRAINIPLALREATNYGDENEMLQKATDRREKGEAFLQGLLDKVKGAEEQPDIDPFQAAEGGRVGFNGGGAVGADDNFAKELEYYFLNDDVELPKAESYRETTNPVSVLKDIVDPRNYPYYADRLVESGIRVGEFGARALPATGKLISDLIQKPAFKVKGGTGQGYVQDYTDIPPSNIKGTGIFSEFLDNLVGTGGTEVITEKTGLKELIKSEEQKQKDRRSTIGPKVFADQASLGLELTAPIFPGAKLLKAYAKNRKLPVDQTTKEVMEKEIDEVLTKQNISRRDFLKATGAGSAVVIAKMLGFGDELATTTKVVEKATKEAATTSGAPPYFLNLVKKIKTLGDDITESAAMEERNVVTRYKDFQLTENSATGEITIQRIKFDGEHKYYDENLAEETYMNFKPGKGEVDETTGPIPDEYTEDTSYLRTSGPQKGDVFDVEDGVPDDVIEEGTIFEDNITDFDK